MHFKVIKLKVYFLRFPFIIDHHHRHLHPVQVSLVHRHLILHQILQSF